MRVLARGPDAARAVLRRAVELGVNFIDTADVYGAGASEEAIADALHPYPSELVIATKGGQVEVGGRAQANGRPEHLRDACEASLRRLRVEAIELYQLHSPDPDVPLEESLGALAELRTEGKVRHVGLSNVYGPALEAVAQITDIVSVQNNYSVASRRADADVAYCESAGLAFIPYFPLGGGTLPAPELLAGVAAGHQATPAQIALAWLLHRSPAIVPIPGTASEDHLSENVGAAAIRLSDEEAKLLGAAAG